MEFLKRLQYKVNLIPVIAKSDTLTQQEVQRLKSNINKEIEENDIEIYQFPGMDITKPCREQFEEWLLAIILYLFTVSFKSIEMPQKVFE